MSNTEAGGEVEEFDFLAPLRLARRLSMIAAGAAGLGALSLIVALAASGNDSSHPAVPVARAPEIAAAPAEPQLFAATKAERLNTPAAPVTAEAEPIAHGESGGVATRPHEVPAKRQHNLARTAKRRRSTLR